MVAEKLLAWLNSKLRVEADEVEFRFGRDYHYSLMGYYTPKDGERPSDVTIERIYRQAVSDDNGDYSGPYDAL